MQGQWCRSHTPVDQVSVAPLLTYVLMDDVITAGCHYPFAKHILQGPCTIATSDALYRLLERYIWFLLGVVTEREVRYSQQISVPLSYAQVMIVHRQREDSTSSCWLCFAPEKRVDRLGLRKGTLQLYNLLWVGLCICMLVWVLGPTRTWVSC